MRLGGSIELLEKPQIVFEEQPQVVDAIAQHGQPLDPTAKGESDVALRVEAEVVHDVWMHLPGSGYFQPAALQRPAGKRHVDLGGGLGKRKKRGTETHLQVVSLEEAAQEIGVNALQIRKTDVFVYP